MSKFCSNCGAEAEINAVVCLKCGNSIKSGKAWKPESTIPLYVLAFLFPIIGGLVGLVGAFSSENRETGIKLMIMSFLFWIVWIFLFLAVGL